MTTPALAAAALCGSLLLPLRAPATQLAATASEATPTAAAPAATPTAAKPTAATASVASPATASQDADVAAAARRERLRALLAALHVRETFERTQELGFRSSLDALPMIEEKQKQELLARWTEIVAEQLPWERVEADQIALYDAVFDEAAVEAVLGLTADARYALLAEKQLELLGPSTVLGNTYAQELLPFVVTAFQQVLEDAEEPQNPHELPGNESDLLLDPEAFEPGASPEELAAAAAVDAAAAAAALEAAAAAAPPGSGVPIVSDPENVVASALAGRWRNDVDLTKRLQGVQGELVPRTLAFRIDPSVAVRVPPALARQLADTTVQLAGWMEHAGQEFPFLLLSASGNPQLAWFHGPAEDPFADGESFHLALARGVTPDLDLLLVGGDFNNQAFEAFSRVR